MILCIYILELFYFILIILSIILLIFLFKKKKKKKILQKKKNKFIFFLKILNIIKFDFKVKNSSLSIQYHSNFNK